eukprot:3095205-Rhodomonas_salina.1
MLSECHPNGKNKQSARWVARGPLRLARALARCGTLHWQISLRVPSRASRRGRDDHVPSQGVLVRVGWTQSLGARTLRAKESTQAEEHLQSWRYNRSGLQPEWTFNPCIMESNSESESWERS